MNFIAATTIFTAATAAAVAASPAAAASSAVPIKCTTAVVGGGWAGVYSAWRLVVDTATVKPADLCLFEQREAIGGRTYSVDVDTLTIDVGAYRFAKSMHLPADVIVHALKLNITCYEPSCTPSAEFNETMYRIIDADGHNAGYATPLRLMTKQLADAGVAIFYSHQLTGIYDAADAAQPVRGSLATASSVEAIVEQSPPASALHFAGGAVAHADAVVLNLPRGAVERLDPASVLFGAGPASLSTQLLRNCTPCQKSEKPQTSHLAVKAYAVYDDPWWLTKLNLTEGSFETKKGIGGPPLVGRYHDGPVRHDAGGRVVGPGALEAVYSFTFMHPEISWYVPFVGDLAAEPLTITTDSAVLQPLHDQLMSYHQAAFTKVGVNTSDVPGMLKLVMGVWTTDPLAMLPNPISSNMHEMIKRLDPASTSCPAESCLDGVTPEAYNAAIGTPNVARNIHLANNDYAWTEYHDVPCCWAEQSLRSVERTLHKVWSLPRPEWLDADYWAEVVGGNDRL